MNLFCTVATRSHLPAVRALSETLVASGNPEPLHVLVADADTPDLPRDEAAIRFIGFDAVAAELPPLIRHYFDAFELCNALKPFLVGLLFRRGAEHVIYLDSDLLVVGSFGPVWRDFGAAALLMTPHHLSPPDLGIPWISEIEIVDMGFLNGGFSAWRRCPAGERMLDWLRSRLPVYGFCDRARGMFVDQKLMPLLLQYHPDDVKILRDPGLNVAFWNAGERPVARDEADGSWNVCGRPVTFFHLSGYRLTHAGKPCSYLPEASNTAIVRHSPWLRDVLAEYHRLLEKHSAAATPTPARFDTYQGVRLDRPLRALLFKEGRIDRRGAAYRRIVATTWLKSLKRRVSALLPGRPKS